MIKNRPLINYVLLTYLLAWLFWTIPIFLSLGVYKNESLLSVYGLGVVAPIVIATLLSLKFFGGNGIKDLYLRFGIKGIPFRWYPMAALTFVGISILTLLLYSLLEGMPLETICQSYSMGNYISLLPVFLVFATLEEVGWRGYALPHLRKTMDPLSASILLGIIWALWHIPKLMSEGTTDVLSFIVILVFGILMSLFLSWIYENTNGSVTLAILSHASLNSATNAISPEILTKIGYNKASIIYLIIMVALIALIVLYNGPNLKRQRKDRRSIYEFYG